MALTGQQLATLDKRQQRLVKICKSLPEAEVEVAGDTHLAFRIRKKIFGYYLFDHHGDGKIALCCKSSLNEQRRLDQRRRGEFLCTRLPWIKGLDRGTARSG